MRRDDGDKRTQRAKRQKAHEQLALFKPRGGKRRGAGRKPKGARAGVRHEERHELDARNPLHVTLRVVAAVGSLRRRVAYHAFRAATMTVAGREGMRIVHLSLQRTHVHLLVEAKSKAALSAGMRGFEISAAKQLNAAIGRARGGPRRRGVVFPDRYHVVVLGSPRQTRHALAYVLLNWRRHEEDRHGVARTWLVDPYSSGGEFPDWQERMDPPFLVSGSSLYDPLVVAQPQTWLLREGWKRHGLISYREVPAARTER